MQGHRTAWPAAVALIGIPFWTAVLYGATDLGWVTSAVIVLLGAMLIGTLPR